MAQVRLINGSGRAGKAKDLVKLHATKKNFFDLAKLGDIGIIGQLVQQTLPGKWGLINILGTISWDDIIDRPTTVAGYGITDAAEQSNGGSGSSYFPSGW